MKAGAEQGHSKVVLCLIAALLVGGAVAPGAAQSFGRCVGGEPACDGGAEGASQAIVVNTTRWNAAAHDGGIVTLGIPSYHVTFAFVLHRSYARGPNAQLAVSTPDGTTTRTLGPTPVFYGNDARFPALKAVFLIDGNDTRGQIFYGHDDAMGFAPTSPTHGTTTTFVATGVSRLMAEVGLTGNASASGIGTNLDRGSVALMEGTRLGVQVDAIIGGGGGCTVDHRLEYADQDFHAIYPNSWENHVDYWTSIAQKAYDGASICLVNSNYGVTSWTCNPQETVTDVFNWFTQYASPAVDSLGDNQADLYFGCDVSGANTGQGNSLHDGNYVYHGFTVIQVVSDGDHAFHHPDGDRDFAVEEAHETGHVHAATHAEKRCWNYGTDCTIMAHSLWVYHYFEFSNSPPDHDNLGHHVVPWAINYGY